MDCKSAAFQYGLVHGLKKKRHLMRDNLFHTQIPCMFILRVETLIFGIAWVYDLRVPNIQLPRSVRQTGFLNPFSRHIIILGSQSPLLQFTFSPLLPLLILNFRAFV